MHFLFSLIRINGLYMFRALLAYPQEVLHRWHLVYCMCVMSGDCTKETLCSQLTKHVCTTLIAACLIPPEDEQVMLETCTGHQFLINWKDRASCWFHCTDFRVVSDCCYSLVSELLFLDLYYQEEQSMDIVSLNWIWSVALTVLNPPPLHHSEYFPYLNLLWSKNALILSSFLSVPLPFGMFLMKW
jgi:hypothetical protein